MLLSSQKSHSRAVDTVSEVHGMNLTLTWFLTGCTNRPNYISIRLFFLPEMIQLNTFEINNL